jgi:lipoic acid synthetase
MLGLGEQEEEEVFQTMRDLRDANVDVVTIVNTCNQVKHLPVKDHTRSICHHEKTD